ncbi:MULTISPECIES: imidazolonepropionase [Peptoniphilus]|uniref:imidazolonepropionase n=1 Tax=Peptoniphilus TaxID=162289 RepID=UPI0001DA9FD0|nr:MULTISPECIES: imidazolonepropionase [Peptoniphilus]EFI41588.1 imidazolonepropionase [Peptoniphilus sp. oral taxon 386 str. F0131]
MIADKILYNLNEIFCPNDLGHPLRGAEMNEAKILKNGYIAISGEKILEVGEGDVPENLKGENTEMVDLSGHIAAPGLIDCHTHLVYGGSRENEFSKKLNGVTYLEILAAGGGILSTQKATRNSSFEELYKKTETLLNHMMYHGVTTVEAKSGYGLNWETEKKQMEVVKKLDKDLPIDLVSTFMAAHAIPQELKDNSDVFVDEVIDMLPKVVEEDLAEFCDVFCEKGVFTAKQSYKLLKAAAEHGLKTRIHSDEIESIGGCDVAADLKTTSAEHLMVISDEDIKKLADANVIGNLLPGTTFSLMADRFAPARKMIENGMAITLTTDSNPGSCPMANLQFIMQLGCLAMKLTPIEVYNAVTINAAYSVARADKIGSLDAGKYADIAIFEAPNLDYTLYFFATNLCTEVYKKGQLVVKNRQRV